MTPIPALAFVLLVAAGMYWIPIRFWYTGWGATEDELVAPMPGDDFVPKPNYHAMLAVTIDAPPEDIWPWLMQMGKGRGGLYSYDWLDRRFGYLDGPSANALLPQFQQLAVGDVIPVGGPGGFPVLILRPHQALVLGGTTDQFAWVRQFTLVPLSRHRTRLISRSRARVPHSIGATLFRMALEPAAFIMTRKMLLGIKQRAEGLARLTEIRHDTGTYVAH